MLRKNLISFVKLSQIKILDYPYQIVKLRQTNIVKAFDLLTQTFSEREPMTSYLKLSKNQVHKLVYNVLQKCAQNDLSSAILNENGEIAAIRTCISIKDYLEVQPAKQLTPKQAIIDQFLNQCNQLYLPSKQDYDKAYLYFMSATKIQHAGKGFSSILMHQIMKRAKSLGYKYAMVDCTGPINRKIFQKAKFQNKGAILYSQFQYMGQKPLKEIEKEYGTIRFVKKLI